MSITSERLKEQRLLNHLTLQEVADKLHVTRTTIFKYENGGITNVPVSALKALANIYGCEAQYLSGMEVTRELEGELELIADASERLSISERRELLRFMRYWYPHVF